MFLKATQHFFQTVFNHTHLDQLWISSLVETPRLEMDGSDEGDNTSKMYFVGESPGTLGNTDLIIRLQKHKNLSPLCRNAVDSYMTFDPL